ncbi:MAG: hypothetical protein AMXMBFR34_52880 [Myxococcaceae bacterium]
MSFQAWLQQADSDLDAAQALSAAQFHSQAVWLAAQAVENAHKALLVSLGLRYEESHFKKLGHRTGEISKLLPEALLAPPDLTIAAKIAALETKADSSRYPAPDPQAPGALLAPAGRITSSGQEVADAGALVTWCKDRVARAQAAVAAMSPAQPPAPPAAAGP